MRIRVGLIIALLGVFYSSLLPARMELAMTLSGCSPSVQDPRRSKRPPVSRPAESLAARGAAPKTDEQLGFLRSGVDELPEKLAQVDLTGDEENPRVLVSLAIDLADRLGMDSDAIARELRDAGKTQAQTLFEQSLGEYVQIWVD